MIRIVMSIRPAEFVVALLVAVGVVVFGSVEEARADSMSSVCASLDNGETSGWFCTEWECREDVSCIGVLLVYSWVDQQIKIHKSPIYDVCGVVASRCPSWFPPKCLGSEVVGGCFGIGF